MRQRYIDFVPVDKQSAQQGAVHNAVVREMPEGGASAARRAPSVGGRAPSVGRRKLVDGVIRPKAVKKTARVSTEVQTFEVQADTLSSNEATQQMSFSIEKTAKLGAVQDLNAYFTKTTVTKRPLSRGGAGHAQIQTGAGQTEARVVKAEKVGNKAAKTEKKPGRWARITESKPKKSEPNAEAVKSQAESTYVPPRGKFMPQTKVEKRPLSKTVYKKKIVVPQEEPQGPVTIIAKPEKQNHAGLIVTIILTIILGAAAGTVAFLLLPK